MQGKLAPISTQTEHLQQPEQGNQAEMRRLDPNLVMCVQCDLSKQTRVVLVSWALDGFFGGFPKALVDIGHLPTSAALQSTWQGKKKMGNVQ